MLITKMFDESEKTCSAAAKEKAALNTNLHAADQWESSLVCFFHHSNLAITSDTPSTFSRYVAKGSSCFKSSS